MILYAVCIILLVAILYKITVPNQQIQDFIQTIPGPALWPVIGNLPLLMGNDLRFSELIQDNWKTYGDRFRLAVGNNIMFFTSDVKDIETIIANTSAKADFYRLLQNFMGTSIFLCNGEEAKKKRKILIPTFHSEVLSNYSPVLEDAIGRLMKVLESKQDSEVDFNYWTQLFTLDVLLETAMGVKLDAMGSDYLEFVRHFKRLLDCYDRRWKNFLYQIDFIYYSTKVGKEELESAEMLAKFCDDIIKNRRNAIKNEDIHVEGKKVSLLDALLFAKDKDGKKLSYDDISYEVRGLMIAGHETTFSTVSMTAYQISLNQDIQEKLYEEQFEIFGNDKNRYATTEDIKHMKLLEKAIKETLRLYTTVPTIGRKAVNDIQLDGVILPKGCNIFFNLINMGNNPRVFPKPDVFDISRWDEENVRKRSPYTSIPFSAGPRNCLGQAFAMWEMKCLLSQIIRNYKLFPSETRELEIVYGLTLKPKDGLYLKIQKRK